MRLTQVYQCLCDETRLRMLHLLTSGPLCVCHFQEVLKIPQVKVSKHLSYLRERHLVEARREQNWMVYRLPAHPIPELRANLRCLEACRETEPVFQRDLARLYKLLPEMRVPATDTGQTFGTGQPFQILFLCTGNSARSILAEFLVRRLAGERFVASSAGALPRAEVSPLALRVLREVYRIDPAGARSKSVMELRSKRFDFVITLCEKARESCPPWPGQPITAHWNFEDPASAEGGAPEQFAVFCRTAALIEERVKEFTSLPIEALDRLRLEHQTRRLGIRSADPVGTRRSPSPKPAARARRTKTKNAVQPSSTTPSP